MILLIHAYSEVVEHGLGIVALIATALGANVFAVISMKAVDVFLGFLFYAIPTANTVPSP